MCARDVSTATVVVVVAVVSSNSSLVVVDDEEQNEERCRDSPPPLYQPQNGHEASDRTARRAGWFQTSCSPSYR